MSDCKYTSDGKKVRVVGRLNAEQSIVQEIFVCDGQEIPSGENFVVSSLHDAPVESWKEKHLRETEEKFDKRIKAAEKEYKRASRRLQEAKEKALMQADALFKFARNSNNQQLQTLHDFLSGRIHCFFVKSAFNPRIIGWDDDDLYQVDASLGRTKIEALKLVSLFGRSDGNLGFWLHRYSDGSGGSHDEVVPCRTYEDALAEAQHMLNGIAESYVAGERTTFDPETWRKIEGIVIPKAAMDKHAQKKEELRRQKIEKLRAELSELEGRENP